jgi:hypothetical protein
MLEEIPQIIKVNYEEDDTLEDLKKKAKILSFSTFNGQGKAMETSHVDSAPQHLHKAVLFAFSHSYLVC